MVTKYDIFEFVHKERRPIKPIEVLRAFKKSEREYDSIYRFLSELVKESLAVKTDNGFEIKKTDRSELLYTIIRHSIINGINYNFLLNEGMAAFMSNSLQKYTITSKTVKINPKTLKKYIDILERSGLLIKMSDKPLRAKLFYNALVNNILIYFGYDHSVIGEDKNNYILYLQKELSKFRRLRKKNEEGYQNIIKDFEVSFIHHSLSIEGNPITLNETRVILEQDIIPANLRGEDVDEVKNYQKALAQMFRDSQDKKPLTLETILSYHRLAMQHKPEIAGKIRAKEVHIRNNPDFKVTRTLEINDELHQLLFDYNQFITKITSLKDILAFAVFLHNQFQHIHPFEDGNSRTTRLITFHLLQLKDIPVFDMPYGLLDEYISNTKGSKKRDDELLYQTLQKIILYNLRKINERI